MQQVADRLSRGRQGVVEIQPEGLRLCFLMQLDGRRFIDDQPERQLSTAISQRS